MVCTVAPVMGANVGIPESWDLILQDVDTQIFNWRLTIFYTCLAQQLIQIYELTVCPSW